LPAREPAAREATKVDLPGEAAFAFPARSLMVGTVDPHQTRRSPSSAVAKVIQPKYESLRRKAFAPPAILHRKSLEVGVGLTSKRRRNRGKMPIDEGVHARTRLPVVERIGEQRPVPALNKKEVSSGRNQIRRPLSVENNPASCVCVAPPFTLRTRRMHSSGISLHGRF
jgi:hypothetical protein